MRMPFAVPMLAVLTVAGCAVDTTSPARAAERFHAAIAGRQEDSACAMLARRTAEKLPGPGQTCADALREVKLGPGGRSTAVSVWGEEAQVRLTGDTLFLHRFSDGWRIRAAGCRPVRDLPYECEVED
ncbi:hypothetical protein FE391_20260 [Nonomuraea sp. KC401]|uniref:Lipoprotein n=1 Tax=Nonomuraea longispora TaxID=1848320 RepID=A0A4R4MZF0_9ACTN|nr:MULTISPECIES: hypothetical protein [Nonomuraea]NBE96207.1 hypothetical protein [Nonomuraea sp. K271]TDC00093.1 hypothetical protein E1267_35670 [Nonomuraea longispora]TLF71098.1 hypothetical protein FE391_20260 [Nonomuraea sp. KC401]